MAGSAKDNESSGIQVLSRAADILRVVARETEPPSLRRIASHTSLPRSTVQRIVSALLAEGFLGAAPDGVGYYLGDAIQQLAEAGRPDVRKRLHSLLEQLSVATGETVDLALCRDNQMVFIDQVSGKQRLRAVSAIGERFPMTKTANGKAVLALKSAVSVKAIVTDELGKTRFDHKSLDEELSVIRARGYALDVDEHTPGISAVGVAFNFKGVFYAISIPAPSHRFTQQREHFIDQLLQARMTIARLLPDCILAETAHS